MIGARRALTGCRTRRSSASVTVSLVDSDSGGALMSGALRADPDSESQVPTPSPGPVESLKLRCHGISFGYHIAKESVCLDLSLGRPNPPEPPQSAVTRRHKLDSSLEFS
jgi:hypothetical protein